jgi:hypothetical protein
MGQQIHIGGLRSSMDRAERVKPSDAEAEQFLGMARAEKMIRARFIARKAKGLHETAIV